MKCVGWLGALANKTRKGPDKRADQSPFASAGSLQDLPKHQCYGSMLILTPRKGRRILPCVAQTSSPGSWNQMPSSAQSGSKRQSLRNLMFSAAFSRPLLMLSRCHLLCQHYHLGQLSHADRRTTVGAKRSSNSVFTPLPRNRNASRLLAILQLYICHHFELLLHPRRSSDFRETDELWGRRHRDRRRPPPRRPPVMAVSSRRCSVLLLLLTPPTRPSPRGRRLLTCSGRSSPGRMSPT